MTTCHNIATHLWGDFTGNLYICLVPAYPVVASVKSDNEKKIIVHMCMTDCDQCM